jgi:hypothetical protein
MLVTPGKKDVLDCLIHDYLHNYCMLLWTDLSEKDKALVLCGSDLIKAWNDCPYVPAYIVWMLATFCTKEEQVLLWNDLDVEHAKTWWVLSTPVIHKYASKVVSFGTRIKKEKNNVNCV